MDEIYSKQEDLKKIAGEYLHSIIFHNLDKVKEMYKSVLNFELCDIEWLFIAVLKRHDCVHRAGYGKEGNQIEISRKELIKLVTDCTTLINDISKNS